MPIQLQGCRCVFSVDKNTPASLRVAEGRITHIFQDQTAIPPSEYIAIDMSDFLIMPGLINAHDHLHFALHPRLGNPPYRNYIEWGEDIHNCNADVIAHYNAVPRDVRLWWGGLRNLFCGVTTVCHHDTLWPQLQRGDFPIQVLQRFGWAHSVALGGDIRRKHAATPAGSAFIVHTCEGLDSVAVEEVFTLDRLGVLDANTVLVHGLAIDNDGIALVQQCKASLIVCPSSNHFLFGRMPQMQRRSIANVALGNDSPITATGDLLDEVRFAIQHCDVIPSDAYHMVTEAAASVLRLRSGEGAIRLGGVADLIAIRDTGQSVAKRLQSLSMEHIEFVMIHGCIQLASDNVYRHLPAYSTEGLNPLWVNGHLRWLRAPIKDLLQSAEAILGTGQVQMSGRSLRWMETDAFCNRETWLEQSTSGIGRR